MTLFCFTPSQFAACSRARRQQSSFESVIRVAGPAAFDAEMSAANRDEGLAVVCWTADWCLLNSEAVAEFETLAKMHREDARFLLCNIDRVPELAAEFAVHDLPSFHIFQDGSPVERLSGLSSVDVVPSLLQCYSKLSSSLGNDSCTSPTDSNCSTSWPALTSLSKSPLESSCEGSQSSFGSLPAFTSRDIPAAKSRTSALSTTTSTSERSYLPRYVRAHLGSETIKQRSTSWDIQRSEVSQKNGPQLRHCLSLDSGRTSSL